MKIRKSELVNTYAQSIGIGASGELIDKKIHAAALEDGSSYTGEEVARICNELEKEGGLIRIVAQTFLVQLERRKSEEQRLLLDNIETQIWYLIDATTYGAVNRARAQFLGVAMDDLEDRNLRDLLGKEESDICIAENIEVFETGKQTRTEARIRNSSGDSRLLVITRTPKLDSCGDVEYVICAAEDITERRAAEGRIKHLNSVLKAIRNVNQLIVVEKNRDQLLQRTCDALVDARGYDSVWLGFLRGDGGFATVRGSGSVEGVSRFCERVIDGDCPPFIRDALGMEDMLMSVDISEEYADRNFWGMHAGKKVVITRVEHAGRLFGLLVVLLAADTDAGEEERGLFTEVASDIAFALHGIDMDDERIVSEKALSGSEKMLSQILEGSPVPTFVIDNMHTVTHWNRACETLTGLAACEIVGTARPWSAFYAEERQVMADIVVEDIPEEELEAKLARYDYEHQGSNLVEGGYGTEGFFPNLGEGGKWLFITAAPLRDNRGRITGAIETLQDVTERKLAEDRIIKSLREKEVLLREIHHRVKNNLQVISSLLSMQARATRDPGAVEALSESRDRVNAMALIHAQLYESRKLSEINIKKFVNDLLIQLFRSYPVSGRGITQTIHIDEHPFQISVAMPVGLIINELLSNALEHAFDGRRGGTIEITLTISDRGEGRLIVSDDGVGLPDGFDINATGTLGMRLVRILVEDQLRGRLLVSGCEGTTFNIEFDIDNEAGGARRE
ncbi:MAG: hypothetical protein C5S47_02545 [Candidatus Methanogasteraceae archaeon]|nr:MAG: hypothetical protein C5S47_02545 [ANME-2 cluster archaeon]